MKYVTFDSFEKKPLLEFIIGRFSKVECSKGTENRKPLKKYNPSYDFPLSWKKSKTLFIYTPTQEDCAVLLMQTKYKGVITMKIQKLFLFQAPAFH